MEICETFGENVRRIRRAKNMSQEDLAGDAGLHRTYISELERKGGRNPTLKVVGRIAKALDVQPGKLLEPNNSPD